MKHKTKILKFILIFIMIVLLLVMFKSKQFLSKAKVDDFLFLKLFSNQSKASDEDYSFKVNYSDSNFKTVNLSDTVNKNFNKKIAPGTNGKFNIILNSNKYLQYKVVFKSINEKPKNLKFMALTNGEKLIKSNTLEEFDDNLKGCIDKNAKVNITILWYWPYEGEKQEEEIDIQDTKDGKNIEKYQFEVCVLGEET